MATENKMATETGSQRTDIKKANEISKELFDIFYSKKSTSDVYLEEISMEDTIRLMDRLQSVQSRLICSLGKKIRGY